MSARNSRRKHSVGPNIIYSIGLQMKWRSKHLEQRCIALRVSHFHFALFLSHNCVISSKLSPSLAASIEKFSQLLCYHLIVPWEFQDIAWQSEWQVVHNKYNLYKNLRIWCKVQLLEVCKFVSLQPFMLLWKRIIMPPPPWKITWYFQNSASNKGNLHKIVPTDSSTGTFQLQTSEESTSYGSL